MGTIWCRSIAPYLPSELPVVDLSELPAETRRQEVQTVRAGPVATADSISQRVRWCGVELLQAGRGGTCAAGTACTTSSATAGRWTLLVREMVTAYLRVLRRARPPPLPELPIQYADYAVWQRQHLQGEVLDGCWTTG